MKRHKGMIVLVLLVLAVLLGSTVTYVVDETKDIVLIDRLGKIDRVVFGKDDPGLHFKWPYPFERTIRFDSRKQVFNDSFSQLQIGGKTNITMSLFCTWNIDDARKYYVQNKRGTEPTTILRPLLSSQMKSVLGSYKMEQLVNTDPDVMKLDEIEAKVREGVQAQAMKTYGISIGEVGIRSLGLPETVSQAVIAAMIAEREKEIKRLQANGQATADAIVSRAQAARETILEFARRKAGDIRTQGQTQAAEYYAEFKEYPEFAMFLRSIESLKKQLQDRSVFLLDGETLPILRWLREAPSLEAFENNPADKMAREQ